MLNGYRCTERVVCEVLFPTWDRVVGTLRNQVEAILAGEKQELRKFGGERGKCKFGRRGKVLIGEKRGGRGDEAEWNLLICLIDC